MPVYNRNVFALRTGPASFWHTCLSGVQSFHWSVDLKWSNIKSAPTLGSEGSLGPCIHPLGFEVRRSVCQSMLVPRYALKPTSSAGSSTPRASTQLLQDIEDSYLKPRKLHHDSPQPPRLFFYTCPLHIPLPCPWHAPSCSTHRMHYGVEEMRRVMVLVTMRSAPP